MHLDFAVGVFVPARLPGEEGPDVTGARDDLLSFVFDLN